MHPRIPSVCLVKRGGQGSHSGPAGSPVRMTQPENDKSETDVDDDTYVGETNPDDALDVGESGAEARSQDG